MTELLGRGGQDRNSAHWPVARAFSEVLPDGDKPGQWIQSLLNRREELEQEQHSAF